MRSAAIAWLLDLYGFKVYTLIGGYKKYRNNVLETFKISFELLSFVEAIKSIIFFFSFCAISIALS